MRIRSALGAGFILGGSIFLVVNSVILYRGAARFGHDEIDRLAFGIAAAVVPWVIAGISLAVGMTWRKVDLGLISFHRPTATTISVVAMWGLFVAYNIGNGLGVIGSAREEVVAEISKSSDDLKDARGRRSRLIEQRDSIPDHRPATAVEILIAGEQLKRQWASSKNCTDPKGTSQRNYCLALSGLEAELANAKRAESLDAEIAELDRDIKIHKPAVSVADPQVMAISDLTGFSSERVRMYLPAATPVILEVGGALCWHIGFSILGLSLLPRRNEQPGTAEAPEPVFNAAPLMSPEKANSQSSTSLEALTAQRRLCEWFFRECSRPVTAGSMSEDEWFEHYQAICKRSGDKPLALESFRRIASRYVPRIQQIDGKTYYSEVLPLIPESA